MIRISAEFEHPEQADAVLRDLRKYAIGRVTLNSKVKRNDDVPVNYPIKPEYLNGSHTQYLNGLPHILSGGPIYDEYFEPSERTGVTLSFTVPREHLNVVKSTLLQGGGFSVSVI